MKEVFISYRRHTDMARAGRVADFLTDHLEETTIFMDVHGILPGDDFVEKIAAKLSECSAFVPVMGPNWLSVRKGLRRRLFLPNDFVRLEILVALHRSVPIIPVLVGGAAMPAESSLPKSLAPFAARQAIEISDQGFREEALGLVEAIKSSLQRSPAMDEAGLQAERERVTQLISADIEESKRREKRRTWVFACSTVLAVLAAVVLWILFHGTIAEPQFAERTITPDPVALRVSHENDTVAWQTLSDPAHNLRPQSFPVSRGDTEPRLTLERTLGSRGLGMTKAIEGSGKIVFHAVGSTGNATSLPSMYVVPEAMATEFTNRTGAAKPSFLFLLGDVILNFGEGKYYYDQFYAPYRNYPAPILAVAGNHDGIVALGSTTRTLDGFLANFCSQDFHQAPDALNLVRTAQIQPGVYFTFEAPFVRVLALYSNVLENQGIISRRGDTVPELSDVQLRFLEAALTRVRNERFAGALIVAVHHGVYVASARHPVSSPGLADDLDVLFRKTGVWPHAVLSGHAHNYERFTRTVDGMTIPYVTAGAGGASLARVPAGPMNLQAVGDSVQLVRSDGNHHGYLRITVDRTQLRIEYQPVGVVAGEAANDSVTVDLRTHQVVGAGSN